LAIIRASYDPKQLGLTPYLDNLAGLYEDKEDYDKAELLYKQVLEIRKEALGSKHFDVSTALNNLAVLYQARGNYAEAERLYKEALAIRQEITQHLDQRRSTPLDTK
jgi:tetratricopeptide (TPR) repeat protein